MKGLGIAAGAKRPGATKAEPTATTTATATPEARPEAQPAQPAQPARGLGIAPGAKRPGAKKAAEPVAEPVAESVAEPPTPPASAEPEGGNGDAPAPPVKGLGIAKGARPPGKRT